MYDVIIVGAGTAGCVLAERLSRTRDLRVLLVEAGGSPTSRFVKIPSGFARLFKGPLDWNFTSEPQIRAGGRSIYIPRGKMLGGSANMNAQIHQWCHPADFSDWVDAGASGWSWADVAPVFRAQEHWLGEDPEGHRGRNGPMYVSPNRHVHRLTRAFVASARAAGLAGPPGYNGRAYEGVWIVELAHKSGSRFSSYDAYLRPARARSNLQVLSNAHVLRVNIANRRCVGISLRCDGVDQSFNAHGVVLAAGAFGSPLVLMHSGIGPAETLNRLGIAVHHDSPEVGDNLQEHPLSGVQYQVRGSDTLKTAESLPNILRYLVLKRGVLASNAVEAIAFMRSRMDTDGPPDVELIFAPFEWRKEGLERPQLDAFTIGVTVVGSRSRGSVRIRSSNPFEPPRIDFNLLGDPEGKDAAAMLAGTRLARKIAGMHPLAQFVDHELLPGAEYQADDVLLRELGHQLQTVYHPTSSCRMGSDARAVVDPQLQVRGVDNLWVADASVMPMVPRGHPNAVVAMIAYRAADWIASKVVERRSRGTMDVSNAN